MNGFTIFSCMLSSGAHELRAPAVFSHFTDEKTEAKTDGEAGLRGHSWEPARLG